MSNFGEADLTLSTCADGNSLLFPWSWALTGDDGNESGSWKYDNSIVTDVMEIDWSSYIGGAAVKPPGDVVAGGGPCAPGQILGFAVDNGENISRSGYAAGGSGNGMLPMRHPVAYWLHAQEVTAVKHVGYIGVYTQGPYGKVSIYERTFLTIRFGTLPYRVLSDAAVAGEEWLRFTTKTLKNAGKFVSLDAKFKFSDPNAPSVGNNSPIPPSKIGVSIPTTTIEYVWYQVPETYILENGSYPANILNCEGKVNSVVFDSYPIGTLLCESADITPMEAPVDPVTLGIDPTYPPRLYKVRVIMRQYDPPRSAIPPSDTYLNRGFNLLVDTDGFAYSVITTTNSAPPYQGTDLSQIFDHV